MIQDIEPKLNNQYKNIKPKDNDYVLSYSGRRVLLSKKAETLEYLTYEKYKQINQGDDTLVYFFSIGNNSYFYEKNEIEADGFEYVPMFKTRTMKPMDKVMAAATGWHLNIWYKSNKFCGACGCNLEHDDKIRMLKCPKCGNQVFPKVAPAVIVGVTDNDKILLTKYADREYKRYALIAGFTEIGETIEETAAREVFEETGVHIKDITYYKSQPWGYDGNVLMGFFAKLDGNRKITMDEDELSVAEWVNYKDVPDDEEKISLTREMMTYFRKERENESKRRENKCNESIRQ